MSLPESPSARQKPVFADSLRRGLLLGAAVLVLALPPAVSLLRAPSGSQANTGAPTVSPQARRLADWVLSSGDNHKLAFVIVDKQQATVYAFEPGGRLKAATPALLGAAAGDDSAPGIGDKPLSQVRPEEKTTPAGRFRAELGMNTGGEDVVWVDYDAAVSMHRVRANVKAERRLERLASATPDDNRISFGCINLPPSFYEQVLRPMARAGAVIYVLPEVRSLGQTFAGYYEAPEIPVRMARSGSI